MIQDGRRGFVRMLTVVASVASAAALPAIAKEAMTEDSVRKQFVLAAEPEGATSIVVAKENLEKQPDVPQPVLIVGQIGAREHDPFLEGKASFIMIDIVDDGHAKKPGHDADNCPFCKKRQAKLPLAAIQFVDGDGKVILFDSRKLFGLAKGREVVVRGTATYNTKLPMPVVQVTADAIHVRPK
jgi:hypothetical protein